MSKSLVMTACEIEAELKAMGDKKRAQQQQRFFKTGPGEYGEGDVFLGIPVPVLRKLARVYRGSALNEIQQLLKAPYHEARLLALLLLIQTYAGGNDSLKAAVYELYLQHTRYINNWDLVDLSAHPIVGAHLWDRSRRPLYILSRSQNLWERRIAVLATHHFIKRGDFADTLKLSRRLINDSEDLIHKAVGWMLREIGKRDRTAEEQFLKEHYRSMPRTMLRYAIEKFPPSRRQQYLQGKV